MTDYEYDLIQVERLRRLRKAKALLSKKKLNVWTYLILIIRIVDEIQDRVNAGPKIPLSAEEREDLRQRAIQSACMSNW